MPTPKKPAPCPKCSKQRYRAKDGKPLCRPCRAKAARDRYHGIVLAKPIVPKNRETVQCQCGEWFERSTNREAVSQFCHRCRSANAAADPTPEEIQAGCAAIRAAWGNRDYYQRAGLRYEPYEIEQHESAYLLPGGMTERDVFNF